MRKKWKVARNGWKTAFYFTQRQTFLVVVYFQIWMNVFREQKQFVDNRPVCDTRGNTTWVVRSLPHTMCDESNGGAGPHMVVGASRSSGSHMVGFQPQRTEQYREQRTKFLTMRYGAHQMKLVRKRLKVEEWLDNELRSLYGCVSIPVNFWCDSIESMKTYFVSYLPVFRL